MNRLTISTIAQKYISVTDCYVSGIAISCKKHLKSCNIVQALEELIQNILELLDVMIYVTNIIYEKDCHKKRSEMLTWKSRHIVK